LGAKGIGMGGASIGLADEWTAIYWNPAGLTQLQGKGGEVDMSRLCIDGSDGNGVANPKMIFGPIPPINQMDTDQEDIFYRPYAGTVGLTQEPGAFSSSGANITSNVWLPAIGGYAQMGNYHLGYGAYAPAGYKTDWKDTTDGVTASYNIKIATIVYNISVARKIAPWVSTGIGLNIIGGDMEKHARKDVSGINSYTYESDGTCDGNDLEWQIGCLFKPSSILQLGMVYRSGSEVALKGEAKASYPVPAGTSGTVITMQEKADFTRKYNHPATCGFGIALYAAPNLTITSDVTKSMWSSMRKDIDYSPDGQILKDTRDKDLGWTDVTRFRTGMEYRPNSAWAIRAGMLTDPSPVPDKAISLTNVVDVERIFYTLGASFTTNNLTCDLVYLHGDGERVTIANDVRYTKTTNEYRLAGQYRF
ncbi:outer membrane protein transport protein, partial [Candidatus Desantisbacteria bacterium]|nr:outer membrane protein transport protein [Candidatus Desantisbacteria bacterium]